MTETDTIYVIDDDDALREALTLLLEIKGYRVESYASSGAFLEAWRPGLRGCAIVDIRMPGMDGLTLQKTLQVRGGQLPLIFLTGQGDVPQAVQALKNGAADFLEKPASPELILDRIRTVLDSAASLADETQAGVELLERYERLTAREREVMSLVTDGLPNKLIARQLDISTRTVEGHRFRVMDKMQATSLWELIQMAQALEKACLAGGG
jgi:FixJ family two-component response regulator